MIDRRRLDALLEAALDLAPADRAAFIDRECETPELRESLVRLLAASERETTGRQVGGLLWQQLVAEAAPIVESAGRVGALAGLEAGERLGAYRILGELGRGGMALVYLAERADGQYEQKVALKILQRSAAEGEAPYQEAIARFERERRILASLEHPGIARILDGGFAADGRPWFAMEHVEGARLDEYCDERRLGIEERLRLFVEVARAVAAAHRQLVVHRDIKPSNILVSRDGTPKLLDFGIAKLIEAGAGAPTADELTKAVVPMTPRYASPEQASGRAVTTASDVYQLGLLLYELLSGERAFRFTGSTPSELAEPAGRKATRPSAALREEAGELPARQRGLASVRQLRRMLRGDLDTIVLAALRPQPERRYESAARLADDVERYLQGRPITARPDSWAYRARKFAGRNRWAVAASAAGLVILLGLSAYYTLELRGERDLARREQQRAATEAQKATRIADFLAELFRASDPFSPQSAAGRKARQLLEDGAARVERELAGEPEVQAALYQVIGTAYRGQGNLEAALRFLERAIELRAARLGALHRETLESRIAAAEVRGLAARHAEALSAAQSVVGDLERAYGAEDVALAPALEQVALSASQLGRHGEARAAVDRAIAIRRGAAARGEQALDGKAMSRALFFQGVLCWNSGELEGAAKALRESIALAKASDPTHPSIANALANLAQTLRNLGRAEEARAAFTEAVTLLDGRVGGDHPLLAMTLISWASFEAAVGRTPEAESLLARGLPMVERTLGPTNGSFGYARQVKGQLLLARGRPREALAEFRAAREITAAAKGESSESVFNLDRLIGIALRREGRVAESRARLERAVEQAEAALESKNVTLPNLLQELAESALAVGDLAAAERAIRRALELEAALWPEGHADMARAHATLADVLRRGGELAAARREIEQSLHLLETTTGTPAVELGEMLALARSIYDAAGERGAPLARLAALASRAEEVAP